MKKKIVEFLKYSQEKSAVGLIKLNLKVIHDR